MKVCDKCGKEATYTIPDIFIWNEEIKDYIIDEIHLCPECNLKLGELLKDWLDWRKEEENK